MKTLKNNAFGFLLTIMAMFSSQTLHACENAPLPWMLDQIENDLAPFKTSGITKKSLNLYYNENSSEQCVFRFKILNGKVYMLGQDMQSHVQYQQMNVHGRSVILKDCFKKLAERYPVPDVDFLVCTLDAAEVCKKTTPLFVFAKKPSESTHVLMPDFEALQGYGDPETQVNNAVKTYPWKSKLEKCFWRGSTTGGEYTQEKWKSFPRTQLVLFSLAHPDQVDAKFTTFCQGAEINPDMTAMLEIKGQTVSSFDSLLYKYLIDVDGNTCGYSRCYWTLLSNSVVFKQQSDNMQWYYGALKPYVHYIPVASNFNDLLEKMSWARSHDDEARQIAQNATQFVLENLKEEHIYQYMYLLLCKYAELQQFKPAR